ncbi:hypothetical protein TSMEX_005229 [Taenia solium]|eukprot:TsM_000323600 transcript=TsM_000323600 gene=TsM_000323600
MGGFGRFDWETNGWSGWCTSVGVGSLLVGAAPQSGSWVWGYGSECEARSLRPSEGVALMSTTVGCAGQQLIASLTQQRDASNRIIRAVLGPSSMYTQQRGSGAVFCCAVLSLEPGHMVGLAFVMAHYNLWASEIG